MLKKLSRVFCVLFLIYEYFCTTFSYIDKVWCQPQAPPVVLPHCDQIYKYGVLKEGVVSSKKGSLCSLVLTIFCPLRPPPQT